MQQLILSIDCGTQSLRAILFSLKGEIIDKEQIFYLPYVSPKPGWAEQEAEVYWESLCKATKALKSRSEANFENIIGIGVTSLRNTMVNLDKNGNPLRPAISWLDQRKAGIFYKPGFPLNVLLKISGMEKTIQKMQMDGKCNWVMQYEPEIWEKTYKYVQISGFLHTRLTGEFIDSVASQIGHIPFNYKKQQWSNPKDLFDFSARLFPVEHEKLPNLVLPGEVIGKINQPASLATGLKVGIPVIATGSDKGCETLGMGVKDSSVASLSFGTTATVQTSVQKYMEPIPFLPSYPSVLPGYWNPEIEIYRGYWMINWFKNEFAHEEVQVAKKKKIVAEEVLNQLLDQAPPGSMGLIVQPYWTPGLGEQNARGAMIGFGDMHRKPHVYRAVIEGLAYGLLDGKERLEKRGNMKFLKLAVSGGASKSDEICRITADVFNMPLLRGKTSETSGLGAAMATAVGLNVYNHFGEAIENMVSYAGTFEPDPQNTQIYQELYNEVFLKMYSKLEPLYKKIREITGYPE